MMKDADANTLATKKTTPTEPPNSGPRARLIMTWQMEKNQGNTDAKSQYTGHVKKGKLNIRTLGIAVGY